MSHGQVNESRVIHDIVGDRLIVMDPRGGNCVPFRCCRWKWRSRNRSRWSTCSKPTVRARSRDDQTPHAQRFRRVVGAHEARWSANGPVAAARQFVTFPNSR